MVHHPNSLPRWFQFVRIQVLNPTEPYSGYVSIACLFMLVLTDYGCISTTDLGIDQELFKFRAIIGHQGPLAATDPDWKGSK